MRNIEIAFDAFVAACRGLLDHLGSRETDSFRLFIHPDERARWLTRRIESTNECADFIRLLPPPLDPRLADFIAQEFAFGFGASSSETNAIAEPYRWFLRNSGVYADIVADIPPRLDELLHRWTKQSWGTRWLYAIDGFSVAEPGVAIQNGNIHPLGEAELTRYFQITSRRLYGTPIDLRPLVGRTFIDIFVPTVIPEEIYVGADRTHPWLAYINLCMPKNVSISATYVRPLFDLFAPDAFGEEVLRRPLSADIVPQPTASVIELQRAFDEFEAIREAMKSQRLEIAFKYYTRACDALFEVCAEEPLASSEGWENIGEMYPLEREAMERAIIDLRIVLEAIYLGDKRSKVGLSARAANLLAENDSAVSKIEAEITDALIVRNQLVHADESPSYHQLHDAVAFLRKCTRRSLVAFLRINCEQERLVAGVNDPHIRAANRVVVPE